MKKYKHLSDVINYQDNIANHFLIEISAGVGSGKNTFIENFIKGKNPGAPKMNVLLITSRRKKVDETYQGFYKNGEEIKRWITATRDGIDNPHEYKKSVICTNFAIQKYLENDYDPADPSTYPWELFDLIVVDEAHSLVMDATYQTAPFYVYDLVQKIVNVKQKYPEVRCKHIILMTGTIQPIANLSFPTKPEVLNKIDVCRDIKPKNIHFIWKNEVDKNLKSRISHGGKVLYFANHTARVNKLACSPELEKYWDKISVSFTKEDARKQLKDENPDLFKRMEETESEIENNCLIPDNILLFITTSRYKEGINIKNEGFKTVFVEAHNQCDVTQMVGRLRAYDFVKDLYIVVDAPECAEYGEDEQIACDYAYYEVVGKHTGNNAPVNDYMINHNDNMSKSYIKFIEDRFKYVRYSYLDRYFKFYSLKKDGVTFYSKNIEEFKQCRDNSTLKKLVQKWFPNSNVEDFKANQEFIDAWNYWNEQGIQLNHSYRKKGQLDVWMNKFNEIFNLGMNNKWKKILSKFTHYQYVQDSDHKRTTGRFIESPDP